MNLLRVGLSRVDLFELGLSGVDLLGVGWPGVELSLFHRRQVWDNSQGRLLLCPPPCDNLVPAEKKNDENQ